jgi:predicted membrane GTPase involved in stress response
MVEVTPSSIRLRKKYLTEEARRRASGKGKFASV